jgi:hypothetical protein
MSQGAYPQELAWKTLNAMIAEQLGAGFDVQSLSEKDFNQSGQLIMTPPSVRTFFAGARYSSTSDSQRLSYEVVGEFLVLAVATDGTAGPTLQAEASAQLADQICQFLAGARIKLSTTGDISEPITLCGFEAMPVEGVGTAYGIAIELPALAQFPGTLAAGYDGSGVQP